MPPSDPMLGSQMESRAAKVQTGNQPSRARTGSSMKGMYIVLLAILLVLTVAMIIWAATDDVPVIDEQMIEELRSSQSQQ